MAQKKNIRAGKKSTRRDNHKKKARSAKVMALSTRDAVKRLPLEAAKKKMSSNLHVKAEHSGAPSRRKAPAPVREAVTADRQGAVEPAAVIAKENASPSMFASQMQLFTTLLEWSPLGLVIRQQTLVADMMFNMRYPKIAKPQGSLGSASQKK
jgi:hypothetical protein